MKIDVVNAENKKVGSVDLNDDVFGGRVKADLIHESVVRANASERRGTHMTKNRALVSGSGKKPWRQKGTGRARVGEIRNPLWRKGGTVFGPTPRSYEYSIPKKVEKGALRAALMQKLQEGSLIVIDALTASEVKTKAAVGVLKSIGVTGKAVLVDAQLDEKFAKSVRNVAGVSLVQSNRVTARDVANTRQVVLTTAAVEKLEAALSERTRERANAYASRRVLMKLTEVIRRPLITEKTTTMREDGKTVVFEVAKDANKIDIRRAIEKLLGAKVSEVRTATTRGKLKRQGRFIGRRSDWKKAYVTLRKGEKMPDFLEGA